MTTAESESLDTVTDDKQARQQARKQARKLARRQARESRVSVCQRSELEADALARMLEELAAGVRSGSVSVKDEQREAVLQAIGPASVCVKARRGRKRMRMSVRVVWVPMESESPQGVESDHE